MRRYFDAHCHIAFDSFDQPVIDAKLEEASVGGIVVGVNTKESQQALAYAQAHPAFVASVGHHPCYTNEPLDIDVLKELAQDPRVVAIGECGLDYFHKPKEEVFEIQEQYFKQQWLLAKEVNRPLMIHCRPSKGSIDDAYRDLAELLDQYESEHGVGPHVNLHFFVGSPSVVELFLKRASSFSFSGVVTFAREYENTVRSVPSDRLLVETDSPYAAPIPVRGTVNDPSTIPHIVKWIANLRDSDEGHIERVVRDNARRIFNLPADFPLVP